MRVLLAGKNELAVKLWEFSSTHDGVEVAAVTTKTEPEDEAGRISLKHRLNESNIAPINRDYSHAELLRCARDFRPDMMLSAGFDKIVRQEVIDSVPHCLNVHFGMLPRYRGSYSIPWAILNGDAAIGVTLHQIDAGIDSGDIILQTSVTNSKLDSCRDLYLKAVDSGVALVAEYVETLQAGRLIAVQKQDEERATYYPPAFPFAYTIPWRQTVNFVRDYVRAAYFPPYPPAATTVAGMRLGIAHPVAVEFCLPDAAPGQVVETSRGAAIAGLNGLIYPDVVVADGRKLSFQTLVRSAGLAGERCSV